MSSGEKGQPQEIVDEDYNSASDEDFNPESRVTRDEDAASSSSEDEDEHKSSTRTKRKDTAEDLDFDNSGDEATIAKAKRKRRKKNAQEFQSDDEGGDGGLVKTRAQRKSEVLEKRPAVQASEASIDVNAVWAQMSKPQMSAHKATEEPETTSLANRPEHRMSLQPRNEENGHSPSKEGPPSSPTHPHAESNISITRTYDFAGQTMHEKKIVPASSAEAKLYLEEQAQKTTPQSSDTSGKPAFRRPKKRTSMFDDPSLTAAATARGPKLNTLQKSKLDWAAHVDQEGMSEELDEHRRAKEGYLGRMDFLGRMSNKREEELRNLRSK